MKKIEFDKQTANIVLWGLGKEYRQYRNYIHFLEEKGEIKVKGDSL